jgi:hypothetical protein
VQGQQGERGLDGRDGRDGRDGIGIRAAQIDEAGNLIVEMSDGTIQNFGYLRGPPGARGPAGEHGRVGEVGPQGAAGERGPAGPAGPSGERGPAGPQGVAGEDGRQSEPGTYVVIGEIEPARLTASGLGKLMVVEMQVGDRTMRLISLEE